MIFNHLDLLQIRPDLDTWFAVAI